MYTRCPSIASIFQKAVLLKDAKSNKIIHRQFRSESLVKLSKIDNKLKPTKRYFSGASNNRNFIQKNRNIQGVAFTRKAFSNRPFFIPKFPREIVQQQLPTSQIQDNQEIVRYLGLSINSKSSNVNSKSNGKITIVIDKNEICNCSSKDEDIEIHVTATPASQTQIKGQMDTLSKAHIAEGYGRHDGVEPSRNLKMFPMRPHPIALQQPSNIVGFPVGFSGLQPMETSNIKKCRSVSDFPAMRKTILPNNDCQIQPNVEAMKMQDMRPIQGRPLQNIPNSNRNQPLTPQQKMGPNIQTQRRFSFYNQHPQNLTSNQINLKNQQTRENSGRIHEFNRQLRKYSSFDETVIPANNNLNKPDVKQSKQPKDKMDISRSGPKIDKKTQQPKRIIVPAVRPATFSSIDRTSNNNVMSSLREIAEIQKVKQIPASNQKQRAAELFNGPFLRKPNLFNLQETAAKNRFPVRNVMPRILSFHSQNTFNPVQRSHSDNLKNISQFGLKYRSSLETPVRTNISTNAAVSPKQRSSLSNGKSFIHQKVSNPKHFSVQREPPLITLKERIELQAALSQIRNVQHLPSLVHRKIVNPKHFLSRRQPPLVALNRRRELRPALNQIRKVKSPTNFIHQKVVNQKQFVTQRQPPRIALKKRFELRPAFNQKNQIRNIQRSTNFSQSMKRIPATSTHQINNYSLKKQPPQTGLCEQTNRVNPNQLGTKNEYPQIRENLPIILTKQTVHPSTLFQRSYSDIAPKMLFRNGLRTPFIPPIPKNVLGQQTPTNRLLSNDRMPLLMPPHQLNRNELSQTKQPMQVFLKKKNILRPAMNVDKERKNSFIPVPQKIRLPNPKSSNIRQNLVKAEPPQFASNFRNIATPTMIPVRKNFPEQQILPQHVHLQQTPSRIGSLTKVPVVPFNSLNFSTQSKAHPQLNRNNLLDSTKQKIVHRPKRRDIPRIQSFLPVAVTNQPNQIAKHVERPKSLQTVQPQLPNQTNFNLQRFNLQSKRSSSSKVNGLRVPGSNIRLQPTQQASQMVPMKVQQSLPREQPTTQADKPKETLSKSSQLDGQSTDNSNNNLAVLFYAPGKLKLVTVPVPRIADDEGVVVKMLYVHVTDTDAQMLSSVQDGPYKLTQPTIAGKSGAGVIVDAGKKVDNVKIGDKVSVKGMSCGKCTACENDNEVICDRVSITEKFGILKRFHAVPAKFVTKLPDAVHPIDGAMIDELSSAIRACKKSNVTAGDNVLVLGGKSLGLWTALAAKSMGATDVCLADSRPLVLEQAKKLGIDRVFLLNSESPVPATSKSISEYMKGENPRVVFDCDGSSRTNEIAINTSTIGGKVVLMKNTIPNRPIILTDAVDRGIDILSSQYGNDDSERAALQFLATGKVQLNGIDSSFFSISNVHEAFSLLTSGTISNIFIQPSRLDDTNNANTKSKTL